MDSPLGILRSHARVLMVEDSPSDAALFQQWLEVCHPLYEFSVTVAGSLESTAHKLEGDDFDVVLLDLGLTDSSGLDTLTTITTGHRDLPVVVLTGLNDEALAFRAVQAGAQDFLVKGEFDEKLLRRTIRYAMERHRLEQDRKSLSRELLSVLGDEQQRIARELHDEVGQVLSGLNMIARSLVRKLRSLGLEEADQATRISTGIQDALDCFRQVLTGLSPVDVDAEGLTVALRRLCETVDSDPDEIRCRFYGEEGLRIPDNSVATNLYRIAQESLNNARKHARASRVDVRLQGLDGRYLLQISDDGCGFTPQSQPPRGMGLRILRHRSELIGGVLSIDSGRAGTVVQCEVQVPNP